MPHRGNVFHLRHAADGLKPAVGHSEEHCKAKHNLRVDYRHLHLKHKIDISAIDFHGYANANRRTHPVILLWRALKALTRTLHGRVFLRP